MTSRIFTAHDLFFYVRFCLNAFRLPYMYRQNAYLPDGSTDARKPDKQGFRLRIVVLLILSLIAIVHIPTAAAQEDPNNTDRRILLDPIGPTSLGAVVGGTIEVGVMSGNSDSPDQSFSETAYIEWVVAPDDAATVSQPADSNQFEKYASITFTRAGTVTVTAFGYDEFNLPDEGDANSDYGVVFTFEIGDGDGAQEGPAPVNSINENQLSTEAALQQACTTIQDSPAANITAEQEDLLNTCDMVSGSDNFVEILDAIAAEELFAIGDALTITADQQLGNLQQRLDTLRSQSPDNVDISGLSLTLWDQHISASALSAGKNALFQLAQDNNAAETITQSAWGFFANGNLSVGEIDGKGQQRDADIRTNSLSVGTDYRFNEQRVMGVALGMVNDNTDFTGNDGDMQMQGFSLSAFGTWYEQDKGYADIIARIAQNDFDLHRQMNLPGNVREFADSSTSAQSIALSINVGSTFQRGATEFGPVGKMSLTRASIEGFQETSSQSSGGTGTALNVKSHSVASIRLSVGGEIRHAISLKQAVLIPTARIELELQTETDKGAIAATFVNDPANTTMKLTGAERSSSAMLVSLGATAVMRDGHSAFASLETRTLDDHVSLNRFRLGYRLQF